MSPVRIGHGYDVHAFGEGNHVMVCGVRIPHEQGVKAHSDGDVALHALCDAMLGAAGLPDIGQLFPDNDPAWSGADSRELVVHVMARLSEKGLAPVHADLTVVAQRPRLAPWIPEMREVLVDCLGVEADRANIKATTSEGLGALGRGDGLAAHAVVLLADGGDDSA